VFVGNLSYDREVKSWLRLHHPFGAVVFCLLLAFSAPGAPGKLIRLRNQTIPPRFAKSLEPPNTLAPNSTLSGLFLLQVTGPLAAEARSQLAAVGVDVLHYVPDDTFVARFRNVRPDQLRALAYVQWLGVYRPEHKSIAR